MKDSYFPKTFLPAGFLLGLFSSQQNFMLTTPDNNSVGQGMFETGSGHSIQVRATVYGKEFTGTGIMTAIPKKTNKDLRSDRAVMESLNISISKHGHASLSAKDGSILSCEFNVKGDQVDGHCINSTDQQSLAVHSSTGNKP